MVELKLKPKCAVLTAYKLVNGEFEREANSELNGKIFNDVDVTIFSKSFCVNGKQIVSDFIQINIDPPINCELITSSRSFDGTWNFGVVETKPIQ